MVSKYHFSLKGIKIPLGNSWFQDGAGNVQNAPGISDYTWNQESYQRLLVIKRMQKPTWKGPYQSKMRTFWVSIG